MPVAAPAAAVPPHKVGRAEMYNTHVAGYAAIMACHDCAAVQAALASAMAPLVRRRFAARAAALENVTCASPASSSSLASATPETVTPETATAHDSAARSPAIEWRIADLGCGTGRGSRLVAAAVRDIVADASASTPAKGGDDHKSPAARDVVFRVLAVDKSAAMVAAFRQSVLAADTNLRLAPDRHSLWTAVASLEEFAETVLAQARRASDDGDRRPNDAMAGPAAGAGAADSAATAAAASAAVVGSASPSSAAGCADGSADLAPPPPPPPVDCVICAWALSHVMTARWGADRWHGTVRRCVDAMLRLLDPATGGVIAVVETLGTDTLVPSRQSTLHAFLERDCGFAPPRVVRTDYNFATRDEGERMCRFFFGEEVRAKYARRCDAFETDARVVSDDVAGDAVAVPASVGGGDGDGTDSQHMPTATPPRRFALPEVTGVWIRHVAPTEVLVGSPARRDRVESAAAA
jgi:hypothetical protein